MTIGKKLYVGFGSVLAILVVLFSVNTVAGVKQRAAQDDASTALKSVRTVETVRYQLMLNRNNLNNFLLSGDPRDEENVNRGLTDVFDSLRLGQAQTSNETLRSALYQVPSTEAAPGRFRGRHRLRFADLLPSERSDFLAYQVFHGSGPNQCGDNPFTRRNH
jgi:hypothetical protein